MVDSNDEMRIDIVLDRCYWLRQVCSITIGSICGYINIRGSSGFVLYLSLTTLAMLTCVYYEGGGSSMVDYENDDSDDDDLLPAACKEGFASGFCTFLVTWITVFSIVNP
ncbi:hypothetical protein ACOME3_005880 [Neoechinorhynchus agilis]